jgi:hypothetical protein
MAIVPRGSTSGSKAQNAEWFASDLSPQVATPYTGTFFLSFSVDSTVGIDYTLDSGTTWVKLQDDQGSASFTADEAHNGIPIMLRDGDTFNMRIPTAGGADVHFCRVDEVY